jgi:hypothetical protein
MNDEILKKATLAIAVFTLAVSAPAWLTGKHPAPSGYDAPWVYPGLDPAVVH